MTRGAVCQGCYSPHTGVGACPLCGCRLVLVAAPDPPEGQVTFVLRTDRPEHGHGLRTRVLTRHRGVQAELGTLHFTHVGDWQLFGAALMSGLERWNQHFGGALYGVEADTDLDALRAASDGVL